MREAVISFPMFGERFAIDPPYCITIGNFNIYFYGIIIAIGLLLAICYASRNCRRFDMTMDVVYDYLIWAVILAVICARLYYVVFFFRWADIAADPLSVFRIRDGGLAIYGGVIGAIAALLIRSRMRHESVWPPMDIMALGLLIGQLVGRWGNFFNREAYGYETEIFCRMGLTLNGATIYVHPTFLYESLWNLVGLILLIAWERKGGRRYDGQAALGYFFWYGVGRAWIEGLRTDSLYIGQSSLRVSQLLSIVLAVGALSLLAINARRKHPPEELYVNRVAAAAAAVIEKNEEENKHE